MSGALVVGLGTPERRDDGVGLIVVERLRAVAPKGVVIRALPRQALDLLDLWTGHDPVWVVDAVNPAPRPEPATGCGRRCRRARSAMARRRPTVWGWPRASRWPSVWTPCRRSWSSSASKPAA